MGIKMTIGKKPPKGQEINRNSFEFLYIIGKGGFGKVWKVLEKKTNEFYALKQMEKVKVIDKKSENSVKFERELLSRLKHPFLVNMHYSFQDTDNLYLVMDLLNGGDLRYHISRTRKFSEIQTKFFIASIILSLEYIHSQGIVHRDIKPENLVLDENGFVRLTDFGIAKYIQNNIPISDTSGTPGYMAPEVMNKKSHGKCVDYFAVGVIGYEFMLGQRPYIGKSRKEIKDQMMKRQAFIQLGDLPDGWSEESADFLNKLLIKKPDKRLGYKGIKEIKNHIWLKYYPWDDLFNKSIQSPFIPKSANNFDKKYCEQTEYPGIETKMRYSKYKKDIFFYREFINFTFYSKLGNECEDDNDIQTQSNLSKMNVNYNIIDNKYNNNININTNNNYNNKKYRRGSQSKVLSYSLILNNNSKRDFNLIKINQNNNNNNIIKNNQIYKEQSIKSKNNLNRSVSQLTRMKSSLDFFQKNNKTIKKLSKSKSTKDLLDNFINKEHNDDIKKDLRKPFISSYTKSALNRINLKNSKNNNNNNNKNSCYTPKNKPANKFSRNNCNRNQNSLINKQNQIDLKRSYTPNNYSDFSIKRNSLSSNLFLSYAATKKKKLMKVFEFKDKDTISKKSNVNSKDNTKNNTKNNYSRTNRSSSFSIVNSKSTNNINNCFSNHNISPCEFSNKANQLDFLKNKITSFKNIYSHKKRTSYSAISKNLIEHSNSIKYAKKNKFDCNNKKKHISPLRENNKIKKNQNANDGKINEFLGNLNISCAKDKDEEYNKNDLNVNLVIINNGIININKNNQKEKTNVNGKGFLNAKKLKKNTTYNLLFQGCKISKNNYNNNDS